MRAKACSLLMVAMGMGIGYGFHAQEVPFSISITTPKQDYSPAEPVCVTIKLTNTSKEKVTFERPVTDFNLIIVAKSDEGVDGGIGEENSTYVAGRSEIQDLKSDGACTLAPGGTFEVTRCGILRLLPTPVAWEIWAKFSGRGSFAPVILDVPGAPSQKKLCEGCWGGSVQSDRITVRFTAPSGADQNAFDSLIKPFITNFKGGNPEGWLADPVLTSDYAASVYAAWARFLNIQTWMSEGYGGSYVNDTHSIEILPGIRSSYSPTSERESTKHEDERAPYLIKQCQAILRYHPELEPVASVTRLDLAALLYITGDTSGATEQLGIAIKAHPNWAESGAAQKMLDVISAPIPQQTPAKK